jgi:pantothenate kinase-related protein Tda10
LLQPYEALNQQMDAWVLLAVAAQEGGAARCVQQWRLQAEREMRAANGGEGLSDAQVHRAML